MDSMVVLNRRTGFSFKSIPRTGRDQWTFPNSNTRLAKISFFSKMRASQVRGRHFTREDSGPHLEVSDLKHSVSVRWPGLAWPDCVYLWVETEWA